VSLRVGLGVDAHRFGSSDPLMLGTVRVEHPSGLVGHSDGDVVAHAVCDALLAAIADGDIGRHFPPGDPSWAGVAGARLLELTLARLAERSASVANVHAVVVCEAPRIGPYRDEMERRMGDILGARVGVGATTTEGMGFPGRGEGIACQAVALVEVPE
jgi:2-C-methyl-D-erythritol 4-phosphate cytidylyltransferase/2-C-methyl-D-erythritol 2,4-cyclodiphosphate synthase